MGVPARGQVVLLPYPFSDLSAQKKRPAVIVAYAGNDDWIICPVTSNPYADPRAIKLTDSSFTSGGLHHDSYVRPSKLFTASYSIVVTQLGVLSPSVLETIRDGIVDAVLER